jgi:predicted secreted protein
VHSDLSAEISELNDRQQGSLARLKLLDAAVSHGVTDVNALREQMLARVADAERAAADRSAQALNIANEQTDALTARLTRHVSEASEIHFQLRADNERIEASTIAALEKLAGDIATGRGEASWLIEQARSQTQAEVAEIRDQHSGFGARLTIIDLALRTQTSLIERISKVETALNDAASGAKMADIEAQVNVLRQAVGKNGDEALVRRIEALGERLSEAANGDAALDSKLSDMEAQLNVLRQAIAKSGDDALVRRIEELREGMAEASRGDAALDNKLAEIEAQLNVLRQAVAKNGDEQLMQRMAQLADETKMSAEKTEDLVRLMGRLTSNYTEASSQADERLHKLEMSLADLRLDHISTREAPVASADDLAALASRINTVERLQTSLADVTSLASRINAVEHLQASADDVSSLANRVAAVERLQASAEDVASLASRVNAVERLHATAIPEVAPQEIAALQQRLLAMETRQAELLDALRGDIVRFVSDNDRRLATLEHTEVDYNLAAEFDDLRRRVEERILGIEQRSVRTLEQVADTVQMLEERFVAHNEAERQSA